MTNTGRQEAPPAHCEEEAWGADPVDSALRRQVAGLVMRVRPLLSSDEALAHFRRRSDGLVDDGVMLRRMLKAAPSTSPWLPRGPM